MTTFFSLAARFAAASLALVAAAALFHPSPARAQITPPPSCTDDTCADFDTVAPMISIKPAAGIYTQPTLPVQIQITDADPVQTGLQVLWNGANVTSSFQYDIFSTTAKGKIARVTGQVPLQAGSNRISVRACDRNQNCRTSPEVFYSLGTPGVTVSPNGGYGQVAAGVSQSYPFRVRNTGPAQATFTLHPSCLDGVGYTIAGCTAPASVTVAAGDSAVVPLTYPAILPGHELSVRLAARGATAGMEDAGWVELEAVGSGSTPAPMTVTLVDLNSGGTVARDQCVTVAIAPGGAMECGDLRLAHGLPALTALGRTRAPTLLYSSAHVSGMARIYADVRLPAGAAVPTSVQVTVIRPNGTSYPAVYPGSAWGPGTTRRVAVVVEGMATETGVYPYTLQVTAVYPSGPQPAAAVPGEIAVVHRGASEFGPGWWLAGVERLYPVSGNRMLRVGGDGSTRVYNPTGTTGVWAANTVDWRDTLWAGGIDGGYERRLPEGGRVTYRLNGVHVGTVNRLDQHTRFVYDTVSWRMMGVDVPLQPGLAGAKVRYAFIPNASGRVETIYAPDLSGNRADTVTLIRDSEHRITFIRDHPDPVLTAFGYDGRYVISRTDKRNVQTRFTWGPGRTLASSRMELAPGDSIIQTLEPAEGKGITSAVPLSQAYTMLDGPRTDVADRTLIWVGRWGAPRRVRDAMGGETGLIRGNASFPALVTEMRGPDPSGALVVKSLAAYDTRGRVDSTVTVNPLGDGRNASTRYTYDNARNTVTSALSYTVANGVRTPLAGIDSTAYDPANGNVLWRQSGGASRRVTFDYYTSGVTAGMVHHVYYPAPQPGVPGGSEEVTYDAVGNLYTSKSPLGYLTVHVRDQLGRDTLVITPIRADSATSVPGLYGSGARNRTVYDSFGRVKRTEAIGPAVMPHANPQSTYTGPGIKPAELLIVENVYGTGSELLEVKRWSSPDSAGVGTLINQYTYDNAGRKLTENDGSGPVQRFEYDRAGNVTAWITQRGRRILSEYDALGRMVKRTVPETSYARQCPPGGADPCPLYRFPFYSTNPAGGYSIPGEVFVYRYDAAGNQVWAENLDARVLRGYYPGGALRTDTIQMRSYDGLDYSQHVYGIEYGYDMAGRVNTVQHPGNLAAAGSRTDSYAYHSVTGALAQVTGRQGHVFQFGYDEHDRMIWQTYPSGIERSVYDVGGQRIFRVDSTAVEGELSRETHEYDARGKLLHSYTEFDGDGSHSDNWFSGLGNLVATNWNNVEDNAANIERFTVDAMGNQFRRSTMQNATPVPYQTQYAIKTGRVLRINRLPSENPAEPFLPDSTLRSYDLSGNVEWARDVTYKSVTETSSVSVTWNLYGADEKLRVLQTDSRSQSGEAGLNTRGLFSEYRYDALGRRILERTRRDSVCNGTGMGECASTITRFIWSGDQLLWELRANGSNGQNQELADGTGGQYGRVSYLHAGGIDRPLLITKGGTSVVPHDNWRGTFATGTLANGQRAECHGTTVTNCLWIVWPGWKTTASHAAEVTPSGQSDWWGGLVDGMRDASGRMYMRNRYYDPKTGQFTQTDPIGVAGGLNAYGFAAGDPVSYSDPYGLCPPKWMCDLLGVSAGEDATQHWASVAMNSDGAQRVGATALGYFSALWTRDTYAKTTITVAAAGMASGFLSSTAAAGTGTGVATHSAIAPAERALLREFFGKNVQGAAQKAANFSIPEGLGRATLMRYRLVATEVIRAGVDKSGVQAARIALIDRALNMLR
ncbi:RHS repeat-associated core domain-containing protein [Longimicrobium terrae]|uniref:RHS repeat-associated protein n=1 Tax=Longimicrobium terrae TaxID=1639882 RepID=A0A841H1G2_9BACT|nr:RHS repeat-associated core domain-containing protein [Longimicrobium terrae]MBB4637558.1 RHS repeat-associated protein [Longimicrobium terrae]MBB6071955.1 RHS repeat-associated protein [Longimicrobium terrae]NNC30501.1 RHS repeat-associated core domain-containing protein [Longimicrobium terrae]